MNVVVYFFVALIAAGSVLFGLDWVQAPMSPMPASKYELRAAVPPPPAPTIAKVEPRAEPAAPAPVAATKPPAAVPRAVSGAAAPTALDQQPASIAAAEPGSVAAAKSAAPACNIDICAAAYRSFTAADCTYQPSDGPRRLCTKGAPPTAAAPTPATSPSPAPATTALAPAPDARAQACNVAACSQSYPRSFSAADCTFQPSEGQRRACTK